MECWYEDQLWEHQFLAIIFIIQIVTLYVSMLIIMRYYWEFLLLFPFCIWENRDINLLLSDGTVFKATTAWFQIPRTLVVENQCGVQPKRKKILCLAHLLISLNFIFSSVKYGINSHSFKDRCNCEKCELETNVIQKQKVAKRLNTIKYMGLGIFSCH